MPKKSDGNDVLPWEPDWDTLLPDHEWNHYGERSWEEMLQPPQPQLSNILPKSFEGSCAVHSFSECFNASMRIGFETNETELCVDLPRLLQLAAAKNVLTAKGSTLNGIDNLATNYGIPLKDVPSHLHTGSRFSIDDPMGDVFATRIKLYHLKSQPMPLTRRARTPEAALQTVLYRERLCDFLDLCPLVACFELDDDSSSYCKPREFHQPYCRMQRSWFSFFKSVPGHCVTVYGYKCPGGDVRTLRVLYQENMVGAPTEEPGRDLLMHPDAIDTFHLIQLKDVKFSNNPVSGYQYMRQLTPPMKWWQKAIWW